MIKNSINSGFTLIELMVVTLVIVMLTGGALTAYLRFNEKQVILNDVRQLVGELNRSRSLAASLQYPAGCTGFQGVNVKNDLANTGLTVTTQCTSGNFPETRSSVLTSTTFTASFDFTFLPGSGYISTGSNQTIVISDNKNIPNTMTVEIGNYGKINTL